MGTIRRTTTAVAIALLGMMLVSGCGDRFVARRMVNVAMKERAPESTEGAEHRHLAYEHSVRVDTAEDQVAEVANAAQATCRELAKDGCEMLHFALGTGRDPLATLRFRASPQGVRQLVASLGERGQIVDQSTTAEDLAKPLFDTAKKVAMLTDYREKLEALRQQAKLDAETLIKLTHELAQVQSDLEAAQGAHAHLRKRVDTEILVVQIEPIRAGSFWRPIKQALEDFSHNLSQGISNAIVGVAYILPWGVLLGLLGWAGRAAWRRLRRGRPHAA